MNLTVHDLTVVSFTRTLTAMQGWLDKAEAHAKARNYDVNTLLQARLAPDMFPLVRQFLMAADHAKNGATRLTQKDPPRFEDTETTVADVRARLKKTVDLLATITPEALAGAENRDVSYPTQKGPKTLDGGTYLRTMVMPNFFFHATTAYNILRHNGVDVGKGDFLGA